VETLAPLLSGLKTGTFVFVDRPHGPRQLTATEAAFPGVTKHDITVQSGQTYFFVARTSKRKNALMATAAGTGGGILGLALGTAFTSGYDNPGPIDFFPLDDAAARTTIAELKLGQ
jgi:6-phosphogluconate dehydrogenase (decarboxylating)